MVAVVIMVAAVIMVSAVVAVMVEFVIVQVLSNGADLLRQRFFDSRRFSLAPRDTAHIGRVHAHALGHTVINSAKKRYGGDRSHATIHFVIIHDGPFEDR